MKKITLLCVALVCFAFSWQTQAQSIINITTSGGSYATEKWVSVTDGVDGTGTVFWAQGNGTYGNGAGYINQNISLAPGTYYVNCYDKYADGWDGTLISITAYGNVLNDNGGVSPSDGTDTDASSIFGDTQEQELEASLMIVVPEAPTCITTIVDSSTVVDDCGNSQFSIDVDVTSVGDGTFITDGLGGSFAIASGTVTAGPYATGSAVTLTVEHSDGACDFSLGSFSTGCTLPGAACDNAMVLTPGTPQLGATTSDGSFPDDNTAPTNLCSSDYNDHEYWFEYTAVATGETLDITVTDITINYYGVFILDNCPDSSPACVAQDTNGYSMANLTVTTPALTAGTTYYIVITEWNESPTTFTMNSVVNAAPTCTAATATYDVVSDCDVSGGFYIDVNVTDMGTATALTVSDDQSNPSQPLTGVGSLQFGPYVNATDVIITINDDNDDNTCTVTSSTLTQTACPPANDECSGAIDIACGNSYFGSTEFATPESPDPGTCGTTSGTAGAVWYKFTGANSDNAGATIGTPGDTVTFDLSLSDFDTRIRVFEGDCGALTCVDGDDDSGDDTTSLLTITTTVGTEYFVLVHGYSSNFGNYQLDVSCVPPPSCVPATFTLSDGGNICPTDGGFIIDVNLTNLGTATTVNILADGVTLFSGVDLSGSPYSIGGNDSNTDVEVTIEDAADNTCSSAKTYTTGVCPPTNVDCANARSIACGETINTTSVGSTATSEDIGCAMGDSGLWFTFVGTGGDINVSSTASFDHKQAIASGSCGSLVGIVCDDDSTLGETHTFTSVLDETYYVYIAYFYYPSSTTGDISITLTCAAIPTCTNATVAYSVESDCDTSGGFFINVDVTNMGTATALTVSDDQGSSTQPLAGAGSLQFGPYPNGTDVVITVTDDNDATCEQSSSALTQTACPPANDNVDGAIALTVGDTLCEETFTGTNIGATTSAELAPTCNSFSYGGDVWYKVQVPSTGMLTIETSAADDNSISDTVMAVYSGTSGNLVQVDCDDDGGADAFSLLELTDLTPNDILLVRVWEFANDTKGNFKICAWSPTSLGTTDFAFDNFSYYPNPVKETLTLDSPKGIDAVTIFNIIGQRIVDVKGNATIQNIDMSTLQAGTYIVKVEIDNQTKVIRVVKE